MTATKWNGAGGNCCCCRTIYEGGEGPGLFHTHITLPNEKFANTVRDFTRTFAPIPRLPDDVSVYGLDYDVKNKNLYYVVVGSTSFPTQKRIDRADKDWKNPKPIVTVISPKLIRNVSCDWKNSRLFYTMVEPTGFDTLKVTLNKVMYDGTGITELSNYTEPLGFGSQRQLAYNRSNDFVYYTAVKESAGVPFNTTLWSIKADGTNDAEIIAGAGATENLKGIAIDNNNRYIYYIEWTIKDAGVTGTSRYWLKRANFDGSNVTILFTGEDFKAGDPPRLGILTDVQFCHSENRVWWNMRQAIASTSETQDKRGGVFSMKIDGTDQKRMLSRWMEHANNPSLGMIFFRLGCGIETKF